MKNLAAASELQDRRVVRVDLDPRGASIVLHTDDRRQLSIYVEAGILHAEHAVIPPGVGRTCVLCDREFLPFHPLQVICLPCQR